MPMVDNELNVGSARFETHQRFTMSDHVYLRPNGNAAVHAQDQELESSYLQVTCDTAAKELVLPKASDMGGLVLDIQNKGDQIIEISYVGAAQAYSADSSTPATYTVTADTVPIGYRARWASDGTSWYELSNAVA